jgi:pimeloyl-ACP methyl ester carboxylesterase
MVSCIWHCWRQTGHSRSKQERIAMSTYVLIHGAWHGAWCWHKVVPLLEAKGHKVITPDLPALGVDRTPVAAASLQAYAGRVCEVLLSCPEPVQLVAHSMGGIAITQAAEAMPDKVRTLVYLTAFLLPSGQSLLQQAQTDAGGKVLSNLEFSPDHSAASVKESARREVFYADCSPSDIALAQRLLVPQATAPLGTPVQTTAGRWGRIPRVYIECTADQAISIAAQRAMHSQLPCSKVVTLNTSHSPFLSAPDAVAEQLVAI